ncbi:MAG: amidohydrolase [Rhizorhabdus sp.]|nr:amidohydrolase [Rhizorhabdus sp.]
MKPTRILDSHVHLTDTRHVGYLWEADTRIGRQTLPSDYFAATAGFPVEALVFIEAAARADWAVEEAHWIKGLAEAGAPIAAIVAQADLRRGAAIEEQLDQLAALEGVRGVRWILEPPFENDPDACVRPAFIEAAKLLPRYDFSLDISVKNSALPDVVRLVRTCPDVRFILDHMGKPAIAEGTTEPWRSHIRELAGLDNIVCKISGMPMEAGPGWTVDSIRPYAEAVAEAFGPDRILYGSDYPAQAPVSDFAAWTAAIVEIVGAGSAEEVDRFFYANAAETYRVAEPVKA